MGGLELSAWLTCLSFHLHQANTSIDKKLTPICLAFLNMSDIYYWRRYLVTENRKGNTHISDRLESRWLVRYQRIPKALG